MHWSTMFGWMHWLIGRAHRRYRSGATANEAIESAVRGSKALPSIEIAARVIWKQMTDPVTDQAEVAMWIAALSPEAEVEGIAKA